MLLTLPVELIVAIFQEVDRPTINTLFSLNKRIYGILNNNLKRLPKYSVSEVHITSFEGLELNEIVMKINRNDKGISLKKPLYLTNIAHQIVIEDELFYCGNWDVLINKSLLRMCKYSSSIKLFYQTEKINLFELNNFILEWNRRVALTLVIKHNRPIGAQPMEEKEDTEYGITDQNLGILSNTYNQWIIDSTRVGYGLLHAYIKDELEKENDERIYKYFYLKSVDVNFDTYKDLISKYFTFYSNFIFVEDSTHSVLVMFDIEEF